MPHTQLLQLCSSKHIGRYTILSVSCYIHTDHDKSLYPPNAHHNVFFRSEDKKETWGLLVIMLEEHGTTKTKLHFLGKRWSCQLASCYGFFWKLNQCQKKKERKKKAPIHYFTTLIECGRLQRSSGPVLSANKMAAALGFRYCSCWSYSLL